MANKPFKKLRFSLTGDTYSPVDEEARQNIGDLSQLETTNKSNLVEAINEAAQSGGGGSGVPSGGSKGQVLTKRSSVEGDAGWEYPPIMTASGNDTSNLTVTWNENYTVMDFFMRQELLQAEFTGNDIHLKLVKAYITATAPDYNSEYHFEFGAITQIVNGIATIATLNVVCGSASGHSGVGIYTETNIGVTNEAVQNAVDNYLALHPTVGGAFSNAGKNALLNLLEKVAYIDQSGQTYWDSLRQELFSVAVVSITATFDQGSAVIYDTDSLDVLRQYLTVVATYADSTTEEVSSYTLSGTLTEGTSTITVSYGGHTDTFSVVVSISLDSIAYGTLTYRQIFMTNNEIIMGDFEGVTISSTEQTLSNGGSVKIQAGSPALNTDYYNSPTHSLKCFGTSSTQVRYRHDSKVFSAGDYICCVAVKVDRYSAGHCGMQVSLPATNVTESKNLTSDAVTDGFVGITAILTLPANRTGVRAYIGSYSSANADCYTDDAVFAPAPSGITPEQIQTLYETYLELRRG